MTFFRGLIRFPIHHLAMTFFCDANDYVGHSHSHSHICIVISLFIKLMRHRFNAVSKSVCHHLNQSRWRTGFDYNHLSKSVTHWIWVAALLALRSIHLWSSKPSSIFSNTDNTHQVLTTTVRIVRSNTRIANTNSPTETSCLSSSLSQNIDSLVILL